MAAQFCTAMAPVPGPGPSQPDQPKATGHAELVPAHVKPAGPRVRITNQARVRAAPANSALPGLRMRSDTTTDDGAGQHASAGVGGLLTARAALCCALVWDGLRGVGSGWVVVEVGWCLHWLVLVDEGVPELGGGLGRAAEVAAHDG